MPQQEGIQYGSCIHPQRVDAGVKRDAVLYQASVRAHIGRRNVLHDLAAVRDGICHANVRHMRANKKYICTIYRPN